MTGIDRDRPRRFDDVGRRSSRPCSTWSRRPSASSAWSPPASTPAVAGAGCRSRGSSSAPLFLGAVTDAMLLGHWYLVQPGLARGPAARARAVDRAGCGRSRSSLLLCPTGMVSVLDGTIDDGYGGMLGWFWVACAVTTIGLVLVTRAALRERQYSAVMAATGLLYLAILTAFGTDLVARAVLA